MNKLFSIAALALAIGTAAHAEDAWTKRRQCAAQAEKFEKKDRAREILWNWFDYEHHYSPKYDRCYVRVTYSLIGAGKQQIILWDAFDDQDQAWISRLLATEWRHLYESCSIGKGKVTEQCDAARAFIEDHMTN